MKTDLVVRGIPEVTLRKLSKMKADAGFGNEDWLPFLRHLTADVYLQESPSELIQKNTRDGLLEIWMKNLAHNLPRIWEGLTIADLVPPEARDLETKGLDPDMPIPGKSALVIGRGPSLFKHDHLRVLKESGYRGTLMVSDGALIDVLRAGIEPPDYEAFVVVTVDGNHEKIWQWYNDPLVDKFGPSIKAVLCTSAAPNVAERCEKAGVKVYWFHPIFDDHRNIESFTKMEQLITKCEKHPNGAPAMQAGGNAGACAWVLAWVLMRRNPIGLIGMDLGYRPETDLTTTYYWKGMLEMSKGNAPLVAAQYKKIYNTDTREEGVVDPVFDHYREAFLDMASKTYPWVKTCNCTGGGVLFGEGITTQSFERFLAENPT